MTCLAFILLPQALWALVMIDWNIQNWKGWRNVLLDLSLALLYPLLVPARSIYWAARELFWGEVHESFMKVHQSFMKEIKAMEMFEHLG